MISVNSISKQFGNNCIIKDMSFNFPDTGFYLLLGDSGSGKTTFLNILFGIIPFNDGRITVDSKDYTGKVELTEISEIAEYITQDTFFVSYLTIQDNLRMITDDEVKIQSYAKRFHVEKKLGQCPDSLSGGEKQRFAIIRALLNKKRILFLDEPTAALDESNKREVFSLLRELKSEMLIICASHDQIATQYADDIIHFIKRRNNENDSVAGKTNNNIQKYSSSNFNRTSKSNRKSIPWLIKWFRFKTHRERFILVSFLTIAICLTMFSDIPERKINATKDQLFRLNVLPVTITNHKRWEDLDLPADGIRQVVLNYSASCPDGNENVDLDNGMGTLPQYEYENVLTLPFSADEFMLSNRIKYGTYFTSTYQIILTYEMANLINPTDMESLIGKSLSKDFYGLGKVDLEIVGIMDELSENEKAYMDQYTDNRELYSDYYFINSRMTEKLEHNESFYYVTRINGRRVYDIYFDSYSDLKKYYDKYQSVTGSESDYLFTPETGITEGKIRSILNITFPILLPLAGLLAVMAILYYIQIRKMEYDHKHQFISVFEYVGYDKSKVISNFIMLNIAELSICMVIAFVLAFSITALTNQINRVLCLVPMVIFTYNISCLMAFLFGVIFIGTITTWVQYHRVRILPWYEDLIDMRDLI